MNFPPTIRGSDPTRRLLRLPRLAVNVLMLGLLGIVIIRAAGDGSAGTAVVVPLALAMAAVYSAGALGPWLRTSTGNAVIWLALLSALWVALLVLTADGVWVAFALFFVDLHVLPDRWGIAAVAATTMVSIIGFTAHQGSVNAAAVIGPVIGAMVAVTGAVAYRSIYRQSEERQVLIGQLQAAQHELSAAGHAAGVAAERERLAREIHDTLAQGLSSIQMLLGAAEQELSGREDAALARKHIGQARRAARDNLTEARRFVRDLAPTELEQGPLPAAIQRVCSTTAERSGLDVEFRFSGNPVPAAPRCEVALLRIAQSALANTVQHAGATRAAVTLSYMDDGITLDIVDDGAGFDPDRQRQDGDGFGLTAMEARVKALGGNFSVESGPGQGTAVAASIPHPGTGDDTHG